MSAAARDRMLPSTPQHYHGDELCTCDNPKPCCDMGRVAWPFPCPWHPVTPLVACPTIGEGAR